MLNPEPNVNVVTEKNDRSTLVVADANGLQSKERCNQIGKDKILLLHCIT